MKTIRIFSAMLLLVSMGCASSGKSGRSDIETQLKVNGANSQLKARLLLKNTSDQEVVINDLNSKYFVVQTLDSKAMKPKEGAGKPAGPVRIKPGESIETAFSLHEDYAFWDRLTKYKIWYESPNLKTEAVQVWF